MTGRSDEVARVGLCLSCRYGRTVKNRRGSRFYMCERSRTEERYPRYPPLPVLRCVGHKRQDSRTEAIP